MILTSTFVEKCQQKMRAYVRKHDMLLGKESVLIAVSGGADSMALLEMVSRLAPLLKLQVGIAHFDHELRGEESRKDAAFVNEQARERGLKIFIGRAEVQRLATEQKLSLEDAARKARYQFLERVARRHGYSIILTGHTADDNAETLLMNLLRGSGVTGLAGIPPVRSLGRGLILARPLLWAGRSEIREFVQQAGIQWREDESNQNTRFLRNRVRQELLPALQQFNPSIVSTLNSTADIMRGVEQHLGHSVRTAIEQVTASRNNEPRSNDVVELNLNQLKHLLPAIQSELVQRVVCQRFELPPIPHSAVERTMGLVWKETGSKAEIVDGISALRDRETLVIRRDPPPFIPFERSFDTGTTTETGKARLVTRRMKNNNIQFNNNRSIEFIDADRLPKKLTLRSWREGDRFQPLGMNGEKKISDFLIDEKIALDAKRDVLVLADDQTIIWVCGMRLDERYRITPETKNVLRIEFIQLRRQPEQAKPANAQQQANGQQSTNGQKPQQQPKPANQPQQRGQQGGQKQQQPTGTAQAKPQGNQPQQQQPKPQQGNQQRPQQPAGTAQTTPQGSQQQQPRSQQPQGSQPQQQRPTQQSGSTQAKPQGNQPQRQQPAQQQQRPQQPQGSQPQQQRPTQQSGSTQAKQPQGNQPQRQQPAQQQQRPQQGSQQQQRPTQQSGSAQAKPQGNQRQQPAQQHPRPTEQPGQQRPAAAEQRPANPIAQPTPTEPVGAANRPAMKTPSISPASPPPAAAATVGTPAVVLPATTAAAKKAAAKKSAAPTVKAEVAEQAQPKPAAKRPAKKAAATASKASKPQVEESAQSSAPAQPKRTATRKAATPKPPTAAGHKGEDEGTSER
ncbi:MAG: tRNA lysidine(34) synthetase TilS [Armatimonadetes bacterium]|nr:tRNA lysidine(34) synthetase TilS [Armatimonadota bacterium]